MNITDTWGKRCINVFMKGSDNYEKKWITVVNLIKIVMKRWLAKELCFQLLTLIVTLLWWKNLHLRVLATLHNYTLWLGYLHVFCFFMDMKVVLSSKGKKVHWRFSWEIYSKFYLGNLREETTLKVLGKLGVWYWNGCDDVDWIFLAYQRDQWWAHLNGFRSGRFLD